MPSKTDLELVKAYGLRLVREFRLSWTKRVLSAGGVVAANDPPVHYVECNGAARNYDLPAFASSEGLSFYIRNISATAQTLTVRDPAAATVIALTQNQFAQVHCDGTAWRVIA